jgi:DNA-binding PadR family transcriptional regulator
MSRSDLTFISYSVLALVGRNGASPHDLVQMMRVGKVYEAAAPSQYYAEPKKLERLGLLESAKEPGRTRERTVYRLTAAGEEALRQWLARPTPMPRLPGEANVRVIAGDFVDDATLRDSLLAMRGEIAELRAALAEGEARAPSLPHRERYLLLSHRLARHFLDAYERWLEDVEQELR